MGISNQCNDVRYLVMLVIGIQSVFSALMLFFGAILIIFPSGEGYEDQSFLSQVEINIVQAQNQKLEKYFRCTESHCEKMSVFHLELLMYLSIMLGNILFDIILLIGVRKKKVWLCGLWILYSVISTTIIRAETLFSLGSFTIKSQPHTFIFTLAYAVLVYLWIGFSIWAVLKFMHQLKSDPELKKEGFYQNMSARLSSVPGPQTYFEESLPLELLQTTYVHKLNRHEYRKEGAKRQS